MAKLIGTAGHVDHGKSRLIHALTSIDPDRLPEEKRRGMTIDLGFAWVELPLSGKVSIVDVPGHERFLTNMLAGALGIDVALLVVASNESVMPQTREHFQILELLPVQKLLVALTKSDIAEPWMIDVATSDVQDLLKQTRFEGSAIIPVSAETGFGMPELLKALDEALCSIKEEESEPGWYMPIDRAFHVKGYGTVVTGTLAHGRVQVGDAAEIIPGGFVTKIRGIHWHDRQAQFSMKGRRTALNLTGVPLEAVKRGMMIASPGSAFETQRMDANVRWLAKPAKSQRVRVAIGADDVLARVRFRQDAPTAVHIEFERPTAAAIGQHFILRRHSPPTLLGGGTVTVPCATRMPKATKHQQELQTPTDSARDLLTLIKSRSEGISAEDAARLLGTTVQGLGEKFEFLKTDGSAKSFAGIWLSDSNATALRAKFLGSLESLHRKDPELAMQTKQRVIAAAGLKWPQKSSDRFFQWLAESGAIRAAGNEVALTKFEVTLSSRKQQLLDRVLKVLDSNWPNSPGASEIAQLEQVPVQAVHEILKIGVSGGIVIRLAEDMYYSKFGVERLKEAAKELDQGRGFTASEYRDKVATSRKYAIPILEYLDSIGWTMRQQDVRRIR